MPKKIKKTQAENLVGVSGRDLFQTPNYATQLIIPYIPKHIKYVWEPACGQGKIAQVLRDEGYLVWATDISQFPSVNFLTTNYVIPEPENTAIITNPPFSLKKKFYERCKKYGVCFALLIPADYSSWIIDAVRDGCVKIIPTRRIDYITPSGKSGKTGNSANFHSMWLTWGFVESKNVTEIYVDLPLASKKDI